MAEYANAPVALLEILAKDSEKPVRRSVAQNSNTPIHLLETLANDKNGDVRIHVAYNVNFPVALRILLENLMKGYHWARYDIAENPDTPITLLKILAKAKRKTCVKTLPRIPAPLLPY